MALARPLSTRPRNVGVSPSWMQHGKGYSAPSGPLLRTFAFTHSSVNGVKSAPGALR